LEVAHDSKLCKAGLQNKKMSARQGLAGGKRMNGDFSIRKFAEAPLLGEAALQEAFAGLRGSHADSSANGRQPEAGHAQPRGEPPPKTVAQVLGEIAWLMTQSPRHKAIPLGDLEWLVMPALLLRQFRVFYSGEQPVGVVMWALADELVARRIDAGDTRLAAVEWKSGTNMRIVDIVAPFGGEAEMRGQVSSIQCQVRGNGSP
jgi:cytolysin-activating lysine-acyltransferase